MAAAASEEVTFIITQTATGTYSVQVDELALSFTIEPGGGSSWWLIGAIIAVFLFLAAFGILLVNRNRQEAMKKPALEITEGTAEEAYPEDEEVGEEPREGADKTYYGLTITALAMLKLKEALQSKMAHPEQAFRITTSSSKPSQLRMALDREGKGDHIIESEGIKILLISPDLVPTLEGMIIDYQITPQGGGFTISKLSLDE